MARLGSRVPVFMVDQLLDAVIDIYHLHYVDGEELATTAEPSWHGSTLACAEFARQGLISATKLEQTIHWALKVCKYSCFPG
jgi:tubulin-specific chaperone D